MFKPPEALEAKFRMLLEKHVIPPRERPYYLKWLRYYLDFCKKYGLPYADFHSITPFAEKLKKNRAQHRAIRQSRL